MKPRDVFKIVVATVGMVIFCIGVVGVISATLTMVSSTSSYSTGYGFLAGIAFLEIIFGTLIMKGYPPFVDMAFPPASDPSERENDVVGETGPSCVSCGKRMPEASKICPACGWTQPH